MKAFAKIKAYAIAEGKSIADLKAMGKRAVVDAAGLTKQEARTIGKSIEKYKREKAKDVTDAKLANITTRLRNGTLPAQPTAIVEEIETGVSYKVTI